MINKLIAVLVMAGLFFGNSVTSAAEKTVKTDIGNIIEQNNNQSVVDEKEPRTKSVSEQTQDKEKEQSDDKKKSLSERIQAILHPERVNVGNQQSNKAPVNFEFDDIFGTAQATQKQCLTFLLINNPTPSISCSAEELVAYYYEEAGKEGIRPDVAFIQAIHETGFFRYGGAVVPEQNNYCGLGTTSATVQGGYFETPRLGVRAHIQHLMAYASVKKPAEPIVDPRYSLVRDMYGDNVFTKWTDLNGHWAVPGTTYGQGILEIFAQLLDTPDK